MHLFILGSDLCFPLQIFSARAPKYSFQSFPSALLFASVILTCLVGTIIAVYGTDLVWLNVLWIWLYNSDTFILVDFFKVAYNDLIGDVRGDIIESDELVEVDPTKTEATKALGKEDALHCAQSSRCGRSGEHRCDRNYGQAPRTHRSNCTTIHGDANCGYHRWFRRSMREQKDGIDWTEHFERVADERVLHWSWECLASFQEGGGGGRKVNSSLDFIALKL